MPEFKKFLLLGIIFAALSVVFGAFGAHSLSKMGADAQMIDRFETAARYQFYHALGLVIIFILSHHKLQQQFLYYAGWLMTTGTLLFSGSLYAYVLSGTKTLVILTPIGGALMILAWLLLLLATIKAN